MIVDKSNLVLPPLYDVKRKLNKEGALVEVLVTPGTSPSVIKKALVKQEDALMTDYKYDKGKSRNSLPFIDFPDSLQRL